MKQPRGIEKELMDWANDPFSSANEDMWRVAPRMARMFAERKGRLPADFAEFVQWLVEFDGHLMDQLDRSHKVFEEHMRLCNRPMIPPKG